MMLEKCETSWSQHISTTFQIDKISNQFIAWFICKIVDHLHFVATSLEKNQ